MSVQASAQAVQAFGADAAMPVHFAVVAAFLGAGAAERDAVRQLRLEKLAVAGLVGARHDIAGGVAHRGAIQIEPDARDQMRDVALGQAGVGAGRAGFHAAEACVDAAAHGVGVRGLLGVGAEHGADGDCGHGTFLSAPRSKTPARRIGSECYEFADRQLVELARGRSHPELCDSR